MPRGANWIAADWGTTHLRVWHLASNGQVLGEARSDKGMAALSSGEFEEALLELAEPWLPPVQQTDIVACGMVGARQGWIEAKYTAVPAMPAPGTALTRAPCADDRMRVFIIPGLKQDEPADVMRGEETQIAGFLADRPDFEGTLCMPGTHTKWVEISGGAIQRFSSSMAGEIFALLCNQSVLKHSVSSETYNIASFVSEAEQAMRPDGPGLLGAFAIRAEDLLHDQPPENGLGKLSGMLIGSDVAARRTWLAEEVVILGEPELSELYQIAIEIAGAAAQCVDSAGLTLSGLRSVHQVVVQDEAP